MRNNCETVHCYVNKQFNDIQNQIILYKNNNMPFIVVIFIFLPGYAIKSDLEFLISMSPLP